MNKLSASSIANREGVHPELIAISDLAIKRSPVDFGHGPHSGRRVAAVQWSLFIEGLSNCDGYDNISPHQTGDALDFYAYVNGAASWEPHHLAIVGATFLQCAMILGTRIEWGGLWLPKTPKLINGVPYGWDMPHVQRLTDR